MISMRKSMAWVDRAIASIEETGFVAVPIARRSPPAFAIRNPKGRKIAVLTIGGGKNEDRFSCHAFDSKEDRILEGRGQIPCDDRAMKDLDAVISLFRAKAVIDGHFPVELAPTDYGLAQYVSAMAAQSVTEPNLTDLAKAFVGEAVAISRLPFDRQSALDLHNRVSMHLHPTAGDGWPTHVIRSITDQAGDFMIARMAHVWKKGGMVAAFGSAVPEWHPKSRRSLDEVIETNEISPAIA